jgi:hypothetical protein
MKKKLFNLLTFVVLFGCSCGVLWISTSCSTSTLVENPTGSTIGAVSIRVDLNRFDPNFKPPGAFGSGGACSNRTIAINGGLNNLCKSNNSPLPYSLAKLLDDLTSNQALLQIQVQGDNKFFQEFLYSDTDITTNSAGDCVVTISAPIDQSSKIKVRMIDVCCSNNVRRIEWMSESNAQDLMLSSSVPKTENEIRNGAKVVTRTATLFPVSLYSPKACN